MSHKAKPGQLLLIERYAGAKDKTFDVRTAREGLSMAQGLSGALACVGADEFASYELVNERGEVIPWPKAA